MLDIDVIDKTIEELENADTTFFNCQNLASLYIVRDKLGQTRLDKELYDIIPTYKRYCEVKKQFQLHELSEDAVLIELKNVCREIKEFINTLYCHTDSQIERDEINQLINDLYNEKRDC